jgi:hypothetical protein
MRGPGFLQFPAAMVNTRFLRPEADRPSQEPRFLLFVIRDS